MVIKLNVFCDEAMTLMNILESNGYLPVMTTRKSDENGTFTRGFTVGFDTDVKDEDEVCMGDCDNCSLCNEKCEFWKTCPNSKYNKSEKEEEVEDEEPFKIYIVDAASLLKDLKEEATKNSRILNE